MLNPDIRHFVLKALVFVAILFALTYAADFAISHTVNKGVRHETWNYIYSGDGDCDLAIFGSSRAIFHFDPKILEDSLHIKVWNFGFDGACMDLIHLRMLEYIKNCRHKPKYVTLVMDWQSFPYANTLARHSQLFPYMLFRKRYYRYLKDYEGFEGYYFYIPLTRYAGYLGDFFDGEEARYIYNGYCTKDKHFDWQKYQQDREKSVSFKINEKKIHHYYEILWHCRKYGMRLNIVVAPEYKGGQEMVQGRKKIIDRYRKWAADSLITFEDFSDTARYSINNDTAYFYNCMHMNQEGAEKFTREMYLPYIKKIMAEEK